MKQLSAVEVLYMASELQGLVGGRLSQVYQPSKGSLLLQFHLAGKGRSILKVSVPYAVYLASDKGPASPLSGFCSILRRNLGGSTLISLSQAGFERILKLDFSSKNGLLSLFLELFSKGNIILVKDGRIIAAGQRQAWRTRTIAAGQQYKLPPASPDPRFLDDKTLLQMMKGTNKTDLVRFLAMGLGLGGLYAEELCLLSELEKKTPPSEVTSVCAKKLLNSLRKLLDSKPSPSVICENSAEVDAVPIRLSFYQGREQKPFASYSEALEAFDSSESVAKPSKYEGEIARLKTIIEKQQETIAVATAAAEKGRRSGELMYENYQELNGILETFREGGWAAVRELQKRDKKLKSVDEKTGKVVVDV